MKTVRDTWAAARPGWPAMIRHEFIVDTWHKDRFHVLDRARCGLTEATSLKSSAAHKLARDLVAAGEPDGPVHARDPRGVLCYTVPSLHAMARKTLAEDPRLTLTRYREWAFPGKRNAISAGSEGLEE